jgi:hypothetical protein
MDLFLGKALSLTSQEAVVLLRAVRASVQLNMHSYSCVTSTALDSRSWYHVKILDAWRLLTVFLDHWSLRALRTCLQTNSGMLGSTRTLVPPSIDTMD